MLKIVESVKKHVKSVGLMPYVYGVALVVLAPSIALGADGTSTIVTALSGLSTKLLTIGTPLASLGFVGAAITHSVSHDMQTQEKAKSGMKAAGVGIAAAIIGSAIVGTIASAFGGQ